MRAIEIENFLKSELIGKRYEDHSHVVPIKVISYLKENGFDGNKLIYTRELGGLTFKISVIPPVDLYDNFSFLTIEVIRSRGIFGRRKYKNFRVVANEYITVEEAYKAVIDNINEHSIMWYKY